jgi:hypothetical protein
VHVVVHRRDRAADDRRAVSEADISGFAYNTGAVTGQFEKSRTIPIVGAVWKLRKEVSLHANYFGSLSRN